MHGHVAVQEHTDYFREATREDAVRVIDALGFQETSSRDVPEMLRSRGMCLPATPELT